MTLLQDQRDRAGLTQLADVLDTSPHPDGPELAREARAAVDWLDATAPRTVTVGDAHGIRVGDILRYERDGYPLEGVVIDTDGHTATTNLGDHVAL
ncbi:hypothetical protein [Microbacterium sp. CFBP 8794]|uniref:hypothetical protein n=1 Tax=Microbacterium sp. CFBP 8794 TaxID=2775269 RepID=UPI001783B7F0|nr:hypothetical protein [Microbacterium sp. CFBP 8794]MBD8477583.1 hypothetical protein [Microbacterium sp. CFBP 8794]